MLSTITLTLENTSPNEHTTVLTDHELRVIDWRAKRLGLETLLLDLRHLGLGAEPGQAAALVIRQGAALMLELGGMVHGAPYEPHALGYLWKELLALPWVHTRKQPAQSGYNFASVCFGEAEREPKGHNPATVALGRLKWLSQLKRGVEGFLPELGRDLRLRGNLYGNNTREGMSPHGHAGSPGQVGIRLGAPLELHWHWYENKHPLGQRVSVELEEGDVYVLSAEGAGAGWCRTRTPALRHAAGAPRHTEFRGAPPRKKRKLQEVPEPLPGPAPVLPGEKTPQPPGGVPPPPPPGWVLNDEGPEFFELVTPPSSPLPALAGPDASLSQPL